MPDSKLSPISRISRSRKRDRMLGIAAVVLILAAWIIGSGQSNATVELFLYQAAPRADRIEKTGDELYGAYARNSPETVIKYLGLGEYGGYGGPLKVAVASDFQGRITGISVVTHRESPQWFKRVLNSGYVDTLVGKMYTDNFEIGDDVDGVSGATYTSRAIARAAGNAGRSIAGTALGLELSPLPPAEIRFGAPEVILIVLFAMGFIGHQRRFKYTRQARWLCMLCGMIALGVVYTNPLTISWINKLVLGFWPDWRTHLYWYLLLGGVIIVLTIDSKNPYCEWFCPFGAAQECIGLVGGARPRQTPRFKSMFKWLQRGLALTAVIIALIFRNPGISSYEVFGTLFDLEGSILQFILLGMVLSASLFIRRPWCNYLCPIRPIDEFLRMIRSWIKESWQKKKQNVLG